jgi:ribA/ribD-fused uncharacterized protein
MIDSFTGEYEFLTNFYNQDSYFVYNNLRWDSAEAAFQAMKYDGNNKQKIHKIFSKLTPSEAKQLGKAIQLRSDWDSVKVSIMEEILKEKFSIPDLKQLLISTNGKDLVEGNTWHDNFWGNCTCDKCKNIEGKNILGKLLKRIRKRVSLADGIQNTDPLEPVDFFKDPKKILNDFNSIYNVFSQCNNINSAYLNINNIINEVINNNDLLDNSNLLDNSSLLKNNY